MNMLNLVQEKGLFPVHSASTNGGEYKSMCPNCEDGKDRFCIWPNQGTSGRYWCRVCEVKGDAIQFCRDFLGMSFHQACQKVNINPTLRVGFQALERKTLEPQKMPLPCSVWQHMAERFIDYSHKNLMEEPKALKELEKRGFTIGTIKKFYLGWNPKDLFDQRERWGLVPEVKQSGSPRRQWLPKGIVIPSFEEQGPIKIKIRRTDWSTEDVLPKYVEISGSKSSPSVYGDRLKPVIVVESELDAILIQQEASQLICCVALGGVCKKPDLILHKLIVNSRFTLISLDHDVSGKNKYAFWLKNYPNLKPWPAAYAKSIGDAAQFNHLNIVEWIKAAFSNN